MRVLLTASFVGVGTAAYADLPSGIIGGITLDSAAYAAFVSSNGTVTPISGLPESMSYISSVAMNSSGNGLIGGRDSDGNSYATLVSPSGELSFLPLVYADGTTQATAINQSGEGLLGVTVGSLGGGYLGHVAPDGSVVSITLPDSTRSIVAVALNNSDVGLISGEGAFSDMMGTIITPYAAYVIDGSAISIPTPVTTGHVSTVAINDQGNGILGGFAVYGSSAGSYVALVTPEGGYIAFEAPAGGGSISGVAINNSGIGLVGGNDGGGNAYAAYISPSGGITPLFADTPFSGTFLSVAMNEVGAGLVGGAKGSEVYAALVQPNGTITPLFSGSISGEIISVAINQEGVGLIGGQRDSTAAYAALVAPNGALTVLDVSSENIINQVALRQVADSVVPQSFGLYLSAVYTQLAAGLALDSRFTLQNNIWGESNQGEIAQVNRGDTEFVAFNEFDLAMSSQRGKTVSCRKETGTKPNSVWLAPFGDFIHLKAQGAIPSYRNEIGGALLGYDRYGSNYMVGACFGYAFNYIDYSQSLGHGKVQEELLSVYGSYYSDHFRFNGALWGGLYQFWNVRHTLSLITSKSQTQGWILDPHIEMASPWALDQDRCYFIEPFFMLDWVNSWQNSFTETGAAGFNLDVGSLYGSLLQSEVGLRFYEQLMYGWGNLRLEEKLSYINQAPFHFNSTTTNFVGSASSFPIAVASSKVENLGAIQFLATFVPRNSAYPYGGISTQVTANSSYQSYFVTLYGGIDY